jgi:hypothetical protein
MDNIMFTVYEYHISHHFSSEYSKLHNIFVDFGDGFFCSVYSNGINALIGAFLCWLAARYILKLKFSYGKIYFPIMISYIILTYSDYFPTLTWEWKPQILFAKIIYVILSVALSFIVTVLCLKWRLKLDYKKTSILTLLYYSELIILGIIFIAGYYIYCYHYGLPFEYHIFGKT